jgi:hypothetical protein
MSKAALNHGNHLTGWILPSRVLVGEQLSSLRSGEARPAEVKHLLGGYLRSELAFGWNRRFLEQPSETKVH